MTTWQARLARLLAVLPGSNKKKAPPMFVDADDIPSLIESPEYRYWVATGRWPDDSHPDDPT